MFYGTDNIMWKILHIHFEIMDLNNVTLEIMRMNTYCSHPSFSNALITIHKEWCPAIEE